MEDYSCPYLKSDTGSLSQQYCRHLSASLGRWLLSSESVASGLPSSLLRHCSLMLWHTGHEQSYQVQCHWCYMWLFRTCVTFSLHTPILTFNTYQTFLRVKYCTWTNTRANMSCDNLRRQLLTSLDLVGCMKEVSSLSSPGPRWHTRRPSVVLRQQVSLKALNCSSVLQAREILELYVSNFF